eukprot:1498499-Lingulodinium_polyedra.AAC.1
MQRSLSQNDNHACPVSTSYQTCSHGRLQNSSHSTGTECLCNASLRSLATPIQIMLSCGLVFTAMQLFHD